MRAIHRHSKHIVKHGAFHNFAAARFVPIETAVIPAVVYSDPFLEPAPVYIPATNDEAFLIKPVKPSVDYFIVTTGVVPAPFIQTEAPASEPAIPFAQAEVIIPEIPWVPNNTYDPSALLGIINASTSEPITKPIQVPASEPITPVMLPQQQIVEEKPVESSVLDNIVNSLTTILFPASEVPVQATKPPLQMVASEPVYVAPAPEVVNTFIKPLEPVSAPVITFTDTSVTPDDTQFVSQPAYLPKPVITEEQISQTLAPVYNPPVIISAPPVYMPVSDSGIETLLAKPVKTLLPSVVENSDPFVQTEPVYIPPAPDLVNNNLLSKFDKIIPAETIYADAALQPDNLIIEQPDFTSQPDNSQSEQAVIEQPDVTENAPVVTGNNGEVITDAGSGAGSPVVIDPYLVIPKAVSEDKTFIYIAAAVIGVGILALIFKN